MKVLQDQRTELDRRGLVKLDALMPTAEINFALDLIKEVAAEHGAYSSDGWRSFDSRFSDAKPFRAAVNALTHSSLFPNLITEEIITVAESLLGEEPYFRFLFDRQRTPINQLEDTAGIVDGVELEVVELSGRKGDVYFMDLRALHTPAPNCSKTARLMLTCRLPRAAVASNCFHPEAV